MNGGRCWLRWNRLRAFLVFLRVWLSDLKHALRLAVCDHRAAHDDGIDIDGDAVLSRADCYGFVRG